MAGASEVLPSEMARSRTQAKETRNVETTDPCLERPTSEFVHANHTKVQLQKICRDLGLTKIWVTKEKLIEMILQYHQASKSMTNSGMEVRTRSTTEPSHAIASELQKIKEMMNQKNSEIKELHELLKSANRTINKLSDRITCPLSR